MGAGRDQSPLATADSAPIEAFYAQMTAEYLDDRERNDLINLRTMSVVGVIRQAWFSDGAMSEEMEEDIFNSTKRLLWMFTDPDPEEQPYNRDLSLVFQTIFLAARQRPEGFAKRLNDYAFRAYEMRNRIIGALGLIAPQPKPETIGGAEIVKGSRMIKGAQLFMAVYGALLAELPVGIPAQQRRKQPRSRGT